MILIYTGEFWNETKIYLYIRPTEGNNDWRFQLQIC